MKVLVIEDNRMDATDLREKLTKLENEMEFKLNLVVMLYQRFEEFQTQLDRTYPRGQVSPDSRFDFVSFDLIFAERTTSADVDGGTLLIDWLVEKGRLEYLGIPVVRSRRTYAPPTGYGFRTVAKQTGQELDDWRTILDEILTNKQETAVDN